MTHLGECATAPAPCHAWYRARVWVSLHVTRLIGSSCRPFRYPLASVCQLARLRLAQSVEDGCGDLTIPHVSKPRSGRRGEICHQDSAALDSATKPFQKATW